ncbi:hypothetical protein DSM106972_084190 [Dulcicalothrix desertica PCC 7102]|uniref:Uncharacterized protein n=1 Tax=Dulcicalothrix desertica PCC 7102 TaxID=232991 RepID=A0A3S1C6I3_9CYAN|nr:hypothetical protein [Dulcicalothrix desertica]RUS97471.1 hypothetical protein DSM106972_084190 [Dulcicalothrix desertica PCC 7102]TWH62071.1 putative membrane protein [Dulcicalothrix desertica PCC 7102]
MIKNIWKKIVLYVFFPIISLVIITNHVTQAQSAPLPSSTSTATIEFQIRGTEPFWNIDLSKRAIIFSTPDAKKQTFAYVQPLFPVGRTPDSVRVYKLRDDNTLIIKKANGCSDGMSEIEYAYSATFISGNKVLEGCAEKK